MRRPLTVFAFAALLGVSACGPAAFDAIFGAAIQLTIFFGKAVAETAVANTAVAVLDKVFHRPAKIQKTVHINPKDHRLAVFDSLSLFREKPKCTVVLLNVPAHWDAKAKRYVPDADEYEKLEGACPL